MDKEMLIKTCELWSKRTEYVDLLNITREKLSEEISRGNAMVSYSGGKDSTVMLHLASEIDKNIVVFHWDYGIFMPRDIEKNILDNLEWFGLDRVIIGRRGSNDKSKVVGYSEFFSCIRDIMVEYDIKTPLVGLRSEESGRRRRRIARGDSNVYPISEWKWLDVWTYIFQNKLPYPSIYDDYAKVWGYDKVRMSTFFDPEFESLGLMYIDGMLMPENRCHL